MGLVNLVEINIRLIERNKNVEDFLILIPVTIVAVLTIVFLFIVVPDFWIESLDDRNLLKILMNNEYFQIIYIMISLVVTVRIMIDCICFGYFLLCAK